MIDWKPSKRNHFLDTIKRKKQNLQRQHKTTGEENMERIETLLYRIELLNILIAEFQGIHHINSIRNLKHVGKRY